MKYSAGTTILDVSPICCALASRFRGKRCDSCFLPSQGSLSRCSACKVVYFCGRECQQRMWPLHRNECTAIKTLSQSAQVPPDWAPSETVRMLFYMLEMYTDRSLLKIDKNDPCWKTSPFDLCSHVNDVRIDLARSEQFTFVMLAVKRMADALVSSGMSFRIPDTSLMLTLFGIICINGLNITDQEMNTLGLGIYLSPSALDHSCRPNCAPVFEGNRLILRSLKSIDTDLEKMTINYVDLLQTREERMHQLRTRYYFTCDCPSCSITSNAENKMKAGRCPHCNAACIMLEDNKRYACSECKSSDFDENYNLHVDHCLNDAQFTIEQLKSRKADIAEKHSDSSEEVLRLAKSCLTRVKETLHDSNIYVTMLADLALEACITLAQWENALVYARLALVGYREHLPQNYPILGLLLAKIGKIQLFLGNTIDSDVLRCLQEAKSILEVAYPSNTQIVLEVNTLLGQCEQELRCALDDERRLAISGHE